MRLEDFGNIIPGAAKHRYEEVDAACSLSAPVSRTFPAPDHKQLLARDVSADAVALIRALWDTLSLRKRGECEQSRTQQIMLHKDCADALEDGRLSVTQVLEQFEHPKTRTSRSRLEEVFSYYMSEGLEADFLTEDARRRAAQRLNGRKMHVCKLVKRKCYALVVRLGNRRVALKEYPSAAAVRRGMVADRAELLTILRWLLASPALRAERNEPRSGPSRRAGTGAVSPAVFAESFPLSGVQFGNQVSAVRRQQDLNDAFDGLMDLADVLDVPPAALALDRTLGLAFGARGTGGRQQTAAHYELRQVVINLTMRLGPGCFAHEWWHALDNHVARLAGAATGFASASARLIPMRATPEAAARWEEVAAITRAVRSTGQYERSRELDLTRRTPYHSLDCEMTARAFEAWVHARLAARGQSNDWLVNLRGQDAYEADRRSINGTGCRSPYPYPLSAEMPVITAAFEHLFRRGGPLATYFAQVASKSGQHISTNEAA